MTTIITKNSSTAGAAPTASDLVQGELAVNVTDKALYTENASGTVVKLNAPSIVDNGNATAITINSSENVGIGVASPAAKLDVAGNLLFSAASPQIQFNAGGPIIRLPSANTLAFLSDSSTEHMRIDSSGNLLVGTTSGSYKVEVAGDVNVTGNYRINGVVTAGLTGGQTGSAPLYGARAWVNFNGSGTVAIRASGNVSSITDNGVGDYTANFTTAMPDANYSWAAGDDSWGIVQNYITRSTTQFRMLTISGAGAAGDRAGIALNIFR